MSFKLIFIPLAILGCNGSNEEEGSAYQPRTEEVSDSLNEIERGDTLTLDPPAPVEADPLEEDKLAEGQEPSAPPAGSTMLAGHYHLVVSFYSPGMGINREAYAKFKGFLTQNAKELVYEETRWGREGEVDFCIRYEGSAAVHPAEMTKKIRGFLSGFDRINFSENSPCVHKR